MNPHNPWDVAIQALVDRITEATGRERYVLADMPPATQINVGMAQRFGEINEAFTIMLGDYAEAFGEGPGEWDVDD